MTLSARSCESLRLLSAWPRGSAWPSTVKRYSTEAVVAQRRGHDVELASRGARQLTGVGLERDQQRGARTRRHRRPGGTDAQAARAHGCGVECSSTAPDVSDSFAITSCATGCACACRAGTMARPSHHAPPARQPPSPCFIATSPRSSPTAAPCADRKDLDSPTMVPSEPEAGYPHTSVDHSRNEQYPNAAENPGSPPPAARTEGLRDGAALSKGSRVQEFEIEELVGEGGFGIVYLARDTLLGRRSRSRSTCRHRWRGAAPAKRWRRARRATASTFELGLHSFINEAQLLAPFDHPSLVKVYRFWEENGTAYMVMPLYEGQTLSIGCVERNAPRRRGVAARTARTAARRARLMHAQAVLPPRHRARQHAAARPAEPRPAARRVRRCAAPGAARLRRRAARDRR